MIWSKDTWNFLTNRWTLLCGFLVGTVLVVLAVYRFIAHKKNSGTVCLIIGSIIFFFSWIMFFSYLNFRHSFKPVEANDSMYTTREIVPVTRYQLYTHKSGIGWVKTSDIKKAKRVKLVLVDHRKLTMENSKNQQIVRKRIVDLNRKQDSVTLKIIHPQKQYEGYHGASTSYMLLVEKS